MFKWFSLIVAFSSTIAGTVCAMETKAACATSSNSSSSSLATSVNSSSVSGLTIGSNASISSISSQSSLAMSSDLQQAKRVLIIVDTDIKRVGGAERVISEITPRLQQRNCKVSILDEPQVKAGEATAVAERITSFKPDHILIIMIGTLGFSAIKYCHDHKIPFSIFYSIRFPEMVYEWFYVPTFLTRCYVNNKLTKADRIFVPTPTMKKELEYYDINNVIAWPHGVDLATFTLPTQAEKEQARKVCGLQECKGPFWLYVGHLSVVKNIQAFLDLPLPGTKILVGEENAGYKSIKELKRQYPEIVFAGPQHGKSLIDWYHCGDVFVFPGKIDTFGLVMLEALACGLPIAAFDTVGPRDVVPAGCGVSYLAKTDKELAACACQAWTDLSAGTVTPQQCRAYAATNFSWDKAVDDLLKNMPIISALEDDEEEEGCCCC